MKNSCSSVSKLLERYFDQEVSDEEKSLVKDHLQDCSACQDVLRSMERLRSLIEIPGEESIQKEDFERVWQKVKREIQRESVRPWLDLSHLFRKRVWIPAVVAAAVLILFAAPLLFKKSPSLQDQSVVEYVESKDYNLMVYETEKGNVTVIWLFEGPEEESPTS